MSDTVFDLGDFGLQSGEVLRDARLSYLTLGNMNDARDNVIVYGSCYAATSDGMAQMCGEGRALDPSKYFIVLPDMFGNGLSTSPSNHDGDFPLVTTYDNVAAQHRLLTEELGVEGVELVLGFSMSAQQAFHWGALHSGYVKKIAPVCGTSRTSPHNKLFLEGLRRAMYADPDWKEGGAGLRAFSTVYAGWFASQSFYREGLHLGLFGEPVPSLDAYLDANEDFFRLFAPVDLIAMLDTWFVADVAAHERFGGDWRAALGAITAEALVMPVSTDLYFPPEDNEIEVSMMPNARLEVIESIWGHLGGGPMFECDAIREIDTRLLDFLN